MLLCFIFVLGKTFSVNVKEMECWFIKVNERRSEDTYIGPDD